MRNKRFTPRENLLIGGAMLLALSVTVAGSIFTATAAAQDKKDEISFDLVPNTQFVNCLRRSAYEQPRARVTVCNP
jgi:hypothetical protein